MNRRALPLAVLSTALVSLSLVRCVGDDPATNAGGDNDAQTPTPPASGDGAPADGGGTSADADAAADADAGPPKPVGNVEWGLHFGTLRVATSVAASPDGSFVGAGSFTGANVDFDAATYTGDANADAVVVQMSATGAVKWAKKLSSNGEDQASSVAVDGDGNIYVAGTFSGATLDVGNGKTVSHGSIAGAAEGFVAKLDASGNASWVKSIAVTTAGGSARCSSIAARGSGAAAKVALGCTFVGGVSFNAGAGTSSSTNGSNDSLVALVDPASGQLSTAKTLSSPNAAQTTSMPLYGISVDASGNVFATGTFNGANVALDGVALTNASRKGSDENGWVAKLTSGGALSWLKIYGPTVGSTGFAAPFSVAVDPVSANVYVGGFFTIADFGKGDATSTGGGNSDDAFVLQLSSTGDTVWQKVFGGTEPEEVYSVAVDPWGEVLVAGIMDTTAAVTVDGKSIPAGFGFYALKLEPTLGAALWVTARADPMGAFATGIAVAPSGHAALSGRFQGAIDVVSPAVMTSTTTTDMLFMGIAP